MTNCGTMTVCYKGVDVDVEFNYIPEQKQTYEYEGWPADVEICDISLQGEDINELIDSIPGAEDELKQLILENYEDEME